MVKKQLEGGITSSGEGQDEVSWNVFGHEYFLKALCETTFCIESYDPPGRNGSVRRGRRMGSASASSRTLCSGTYPPVEFHRAGGLDPALKQHPFEQCLRRSAVAAAFSMGLQFRL